MTTEDGDTATVLVVEDEAHLANIYETWLSDDYAVRVAHDAEAALAGIDEAVDVVLLDRRLPGRSGDEVLAEIRAEEYPCRVAMVTAVEPGVDIVEMEFDDYLCKPVERSDLHRVVDRLLSRATYEKSLREFYALASKLGVLETHLPTGELAESEEYERLQRRIEELRVDLNETTNEFTDEEFWAEAARIEALAD